MYDIKKLCQLIDYQIRNNSWKKCAPKASPRLPSPGYKTSYVLAMYYLTKFDVI